MTTPSAPNRPPAGAGGGDPLLPFDLEAPPAVIWIVETLEKAGHDSWAVGGAVRDALAGRPSGDWDLATHARPGEVQRIFRRTVPIGISHGTVGVLARDGTLYEVTTFRKDVETTGRHATVRFADSLEDDLARRDFTINAVAWHPLRKEMRDPFGGADDMANGLLRTVGEARERFREDYLRILRALRFAGRFDLEVEAETWGAIKASVEGLGRLSPERVREELMKVLSTDPRPSRALSLYASSGALRLLFPEFGALPEGRPRSETEPEPYALSLQIIDRIHPRHAKLRLCVLLRPLGVPTALAILERLRFSNAAIQEVGDLVAASTGRILLLPGAGASPAEFRRWLSRVGPAQLPALVRISIAGVRATGSDPRLVEQLRDGWRRVRSVLAERPPLTVDDLALDGRDLIRMGLKPGPHFGAILRRLLEEVIEDPGLNHPDALAAIVQDLAEHE